MLRPPVLNARRRQKRVHTYIYIYIHTYLNLSLCILAPETWHHQREGHAGVANRSIYRYLYMCLSKLMQSSYICIYTYMYIYVSTSTCISVYTSTCCMRSSESWTSSSPNIRPTRYIFTYTCLSKYLYMHRHLHVYIYIYIPVPETWHRRREEQICVETPLEYHRPREGAVRTDPTALYLYIYIYICVCIPYMYLHLLSHWGTEGRRKQPAGHVYIDICSHIDISLHLYTHIYIYICIY